MAARSSSHAHALPTTLLALLLLGAALAPAPSRAQDDCGVAAGLFAIDGQHYSAAGTIDWAQGAAGQSVFDDNGNPLLVPALYDRDENWAGNSADPDVFGGRENKNNDDISAGGLPWTWGSGNGPQKNDLTDVYAYSRFVGSDLWLLLGVTTRANNGASHVDFEFNQQGFLRSGTTSGTIVGLGPDAGRTDAVDFIVSVDFEGGGDIPVVSFRRWTASGSTFEYVPDTPDPGQVFVCTNETDIPAPPWGAIDPGGDVTTELEAFQFVEIALNLTSLDIDPSIFCSDVSTLLFKSRSAPSFTAELKDFALYQFSIIPPPECDIVSNQNPICAGESATLCAPEAPPGFAYTYSWTGPGGPYPADRCITVSQGGIYEVAVTNTFGGCDPSSCQLELIVRPLPACGITADRTEICAGETAQFCGPVASAGTIYDYAWSGPAGPYGNTRCLDVGVAGTYRLTVTDRTTGCQSGSCEASLTVNPLPPCSISGPSVICEDGMAELCGPAGDFSYAWTGPDGPYPSTRCITVNVAGNYRLTVTDTKTGCSAPPCNHQLDVVSKPVVLITGPGSICPDATETLCGPEGSFTYEWSGPGGPFPAQRCIQVELPGMYSLTISDGIGCTGSDTHVLTADEAVGATQLVDAWACSGERVEFCVTASGTGPISYQWSRNGSPLAGADGNCLVVDPVTASNVGTYSVRVTGKCGSLTRSAVLRLADVAVADIPDLFLCEGQTARWCPVVTGRGPFEWTWEHNGEMIPGADDSCLVLDMVDAGDDGFYSVTVSGYCGDPVTVSGRLYVGTCEVFCGLTQGAYGNAGGKWNGIPRPELLDMLITPGSPLVVGIPGVRSVTFPEGTEDCIIQLLPGGGPSATLKNGLGDAVVDPITCDTTPPLKGPQGRIRNVFLAQTITLSLNVRLDPNLASLELCDTLIVIPALPGPDGERGTADDLPDNDHPSFLILSPAILSALDQIGQPRTVAGLLVLANRGLAANLPADIHLSPSNISGAVGGINDFVDECVLFIHCDNAPHAKVTRTLGLLEARSDRLDDAGPTPDRLRLGPIQVARNGARATIEFAAPAPGRIEILVFDVLGRPVARMDREVDSGGVLTESLTLGDGAGLRSGLYLVQLRLTPAGPGTTEVISRKFVVTR